MMFINQDNDFTLNLGTKQKYEAMHHILGTKVAISFYVLIALPA